MKAQIKENIRKPKYEIRIKLTEKEMKALSNGFFWEYGEGLYLGNRIEISPTKSEHFPILVKLIKKLYGVLSTFEPSEGD